MFLFVSPQNAQKSLIKPIAFKPIAAPHPGRYVNSPQHSVLPNRLTPPTRSHDLKLANHSAGGNHDDGYASQEYTSGSHSHSTSNTSSNSSTYQVQYFVISRPMIYNYLGLIDCYFYSWPQGKSIAIPL